MLCAEHESFFEPDPQWSNPKFNRHCASPSAVSHVNFTLLCLLVAFRTLDVFFNIQSVLWYNVNHTVPFLSGGAAFSNLENTSCKILYFYQWRLKFLLQ